MCDAQQADRAVKAAAGRITQAKQVAPDLPAIDMALVQDLTSAMYWDIISGALSECAGDRGSGVEQGIRVGVGRSAISETLCAGYGQRRFAQVCFGLRFGVTIKLGMLCSPKTC